MTPAFSHLRIRAEDATITDSVLDETDQPLMADRVEEPGYVGVHDPVHLRRRDPDCQRVQRIVLSASGAEPVRKSLEVFFVDGIEHLHDGALNDLIPQRGDAQWTLSSIRFWNISSPRWQRSIRASMHLLVQST
jgi:hypothetical protein